jgi:photosystem II stability/assembly factor-like uncharacterized protein
MKNLFIICYVFLSFNAAFSQWFIQNTPLARNFYGIDVLNQNVVYCAAQLGANIKTTNGGDNWFFILPPFTGEDFNGCSFLNTDTGLFAGPPGRIIKTTDGGISWSIIYCVTPGLGDIQFVNSNWVYACGGNILRSTDGGETFINQGYYSPVLKRLSFSDSLTGTAVGIGGRIFQTNNGGLNWIQKYMMLPVQFGDSSLYDVMFINQNTGFACGNNGIFIKTTNGGDNWTYYSNGTIYKSEALYFVNENTGYTVGVGGSIFKTTNGGVNWVQQISGTTSPLWNIEFLNENTGWICGFNGVILKTTDQGSTWIQPINNEFPDISNLQQNYPNPFNPSTVIEFSLKKTSVVSLYIYDIRGCLILKEIENVKLNPGTSRYDFDGSKYSSGIYYYSLIVNNARIETRKMVLLK